MCFAGLPIGAQSLSHSLTQVAAKVLVLVLVVDKALANKDKALANKALVVVANKALANNHASCTHCNHCCSSMSIDLGHNPCAASTYRQIAAASHTCTQGHVCRRSDTGSV